MEIKNLDDLNAKRASLKNEVQLAKLKLNRNKADWEVQIQPLKKASTIANSLLVNKHQSIATKGVQMGVNALLAKTVLKKLPLPLNFILPYLAQNYASNYVYDHSEELMIKFLRFVKKITDEKPEATPSTHQEDTPITHQGPSL